MHCSTILLALGLTLLGLPAGWAQDDTPEVTVPDASLRAVLEDSLGLSAGDPITASSLAKLTSLEAPDAGIVDLTGLEHATGLTRLDLGPGAITRDPWTNSNDVSDLSPLSGLTALTWLDLAGNSVEDVTPLSGLVNLRWLNVEVNKISDLRSLSGLTRLRDLHMGYNLIPRLESADWLPRTGTSMWICPIFAGPNLWPKLDSSLNDLVYSYKEALRWGRTRTRSIQVAASRDFRLPTTGTRRSRTSTSGTRRSHPIQSPCASVCYTRKRAAST